MVRNWERLLGLVSACRGVAFSGGGQYGAREHLRTTASSPPVPMSRVETVRQHTSRRIVEPTTSVYVDRNCFGRTTAVQSQDPLVSRRRRLPFQESYDSLSLPLSDFEVFMTAVFSPSGFSDHPWHDTGDRQRKSSNEATFNVSPPTYSLIALR